MAKQTIAQLFDLTGKGAIVTGGNKGIGQGIAFRLAEAGAGVMIAARNEEANRDTVKQIRAAGGKAEAVSADMRRRSDAIKVAQATVDAFGSLDILINNAAVFPPSPSLETSEELWDEVLDTNLKGAFFYSQAAANQMVKSGRGGKIINIASIGAFRCSEKMAHYAASKSGLVMLTKALAKDFAPHLIQVNCVAPGAIMSGEAARKLVASRGGGVEVDSAEARKTLGRWGEPDDIAKVVLFLASSAADFMNGSVVIVDAGMMIK